MTCYIIVNPLIMGETTVIMGDTVSLYCNASHSRPPATVQWLSPGGEVVSDGGVLEIFNFTWKLEGLYTCVASFVNSIVTKNSSVQVTIRCKELCSHNERSEFK